MQGLSWVNLLIVLIAVLLLTKPLGRYIDRVFNGQRTFLWPLLGRVERLAYRCCGIDPTVEMPWSGYALSALALGAASAGALYVILRVQQWLPLNPQHFANLTPDVAFNAAISFATTTDWQVYSGENALSYFSQMAGIVPAMFAASATGLALAIGFIRGLARSEAQTLGNFWVDLIRSVLYVMLPLSVVGALLYVSQGVPQNFHAYADAVNPEGFKQAITGGPMGSETIIELLGGNGGGFVGANAASPNENPTALCNFLELLTMLLIPAALTNTFGRMVGDARQGWILFGAMSALLVGGAVTAQVAESHGNSAIVALGVNGPNWEGKEVRFGPASAGLSVAVATATGNGAANATYDSLMPVADLVALANMQTSEVIFGGVGSGLYGMLVYAVLTVFIAGLMVGRTPEYLGKKIERREVQFAMLSVLAFALAVLVPAAIASVSRAGVAVLGNDGPHGFAEIIYAFTSTSANNGSAMAGLGSNLFYNLMTAAAMLAGRFGPVIPTMALAGTLALQVKSVRLSRGSFRTDTFMFGALLLGVVVIVGALTFLPADLLGPIVEQAMIVHPH